MTRSILRTVTPLTVALALACASDVAAPTRGILDLSVAGLPAGQAAAITITGPEQFSQTATASVTINDLVPGTYTINASNVSSGSTTYVPVIQSQTADISASRTPRSAMVTYNAGTGTAVGLRLQEIASGLSDPVYLTAPANDSRLFVVEQRGRIRIIKNGTLLPTPFLDATSKVNYGGERGLLSVAFDPAYATNGRFYIYYTGSQGDIFIDRHTVSSNPDVANASGEQVITIQHRDYSNHNGGLVMFGADGMLYIGTGDGGSGGDPNSNGQNTNALLGKLLRIDVSTLPYTIPTDNPFATSGGAKEIWAYGLRNPWRYAFDGTGANARLYIADVGQGQWEEIDYVDARTPGVNFGWRLMEGTHCYNPSSGCISPSLTLPIHEFSHSAGACSVTGGFVYRGAAIPELQGHYFYSDYCAGWLKSLRVLNGVAVDHVTWPVQLLPSVTSFGMDASRELYMLSANGRVYKIVRAS